MEEKFENDLEMIDYQEDVVWAQNYINDWVAKQTDGHIWEFIKNLSPTSTATIVSTETLIFVVRLCVSLPNK